MAAFFRKVLAGRDTSAETDEMELSPEDNKKLVELFENRNLFKRELEQVRAERDVLRTDLEDLRARHEELHRQLTSIEQMLADPEKGQNAIVYYQLRAVWDTCRQQLRLLSEELSGRYVNAERAAFEENFERDRNRRLDDLTKQVDKIEHDWRNLRNTLGELQQGLDRLQGFWQRRKRKHTQYEINRLNAQFKPVETAKLQLLAEMDALRNLKPPAWPGVNTNSRRAVNLTLLALAQYLYLHFTDYNIAEMARSAGTKPVADVNFGLLNDCVAIGHHIFEVVVKLRRDKARPEKLRYRTEYLRRIASYTADTDTIPEESCLDYIPPSSTSAPTIDADAQALATNILRLNYWDIQNILLKPAVPDKESQSKIVGIAE